MLRCGGKSFCEVACVVQRRQSATPSLSLAGSPASLEPAPVKLGCPVLSSRQA